MDIKDVIKQNCSGRQILFVDPGLVGTGWAYYPELSSDPMKPSAPHKHGSDPGATYKDWTIRASSLCMWWRGIVRALQPATVIFEWPGLWASSAKSQASASKGDLFKLAYLIGGMADGLHVDGIKSILVSPQEWKGQLDSDVVALRIERQWGITTPNDHESDAIGMGMAAQGAL